MTSLEIGMLVQHASLGLGKVVAVERSAVHVVFVAQADDVATKLRLPMALAFLGLADQAAVWPHPSSGFDLDKATGRYRRTPAAQVKRPRSKAKMGASAQHGRVGS